MNPLDPGEQERFLEAMPADERRYYAFAMGAGLRPGEQRALLKADLHADEVGRSKYGPQWAPYSLPDGGAE